MNGYFISEQSLLFSNGVEGRGAFSSTDSFETEVRFGISANME
jgi:hypothetical protein